MEAVSKTTGGSVAVIIPAYNEEATVAKVVRDFATELPLAQIYVFDNNSTDNTRAVAQKAGAIVIREYSQGKGNVVRSMFRHVEADYYVLVDADDTYFAGDVHSLLKSVQTGAADMAVGNRHAEKAYSRENKRKFHQFGNWLVTFLINKLFASNLKDILSGYRVFNKLFAKTFPVICEGFEVETHFTLHALSKRFKLVEKPVGYQDRPVGSQSKLNTFKDGYRVLKTILKVFKNYKPLYFFTSLSFCLAFAGLVVGIPPVLEYLEYSYVYKVPSAILAASIEILAMMILICGIILDSIISFHKEQYEVMLNLYQKIYSKRECEK